MRMLWTGIVKRERAAINILLSVLIVFLYCATSTPVAHSAMSMLYSSPVLRGYENGTIALECIVSWNAAALPDFLSVLKERNTKITFFVSGQWAQENGSLLKRMVQEGHEIGTMGYVPMFDGTLDEMKQNIERSLEVINKIAGFKPTIYYVDTNKNTSASRAAQSCGLLPVYCSTDLLAARGGSADILSRALDQPFDGSILLIQPTANAVRALPALLEGLTQKGYRITTVSNALGKTA